MLKFKYTKKNGEESDRSVIALRRPSDSYFGIDVSEVEEETIEELKSLLRKHQAELDTFLADKELTKNFRTFLKDRVEFK